ncbi:MAG: LysR family transcriptional regulator [Alphaproteobacteria bacterium]|nr:LysR family transcriptional regulator [Alphaproteobacteria bacterium]
MLDWSLLQVFLVVAEQGSLSGAARRLGASQPTIGRQIAALERACGLKLFLRQPRGLELTPAGQSLREAALMMDEAAQAVSRRIAEGSRDLRGEVRVSATEGLGVHWLGRRLGQIRGRLPGIDLSLVIDNFAVDLARREADIALRLFRPAQKQLNAERVARLGIGIYAARSYARLRPLPAAPDRLSDHHLVGFDPAMQHLPQARWLQDVGRGGRVVYRANSMLAQHEAVRQGLGLGALSCFLADQDAELVRVLPDLTLSGDIWLVVHEDLLAVPRVRALHELLSELLRADARALAGSPAIG